MDDRRDPSSLADDRDLLAHLDLLNQPLERNADREPSETIEQPPSPVVPTAPLPAHRRPLIDLFPPEDAAARPALGRAAAPFPDSRQPGESNAKADSADTRSPRPYETFYGFTEPPFAPEPDPRFLYHSAAFDRASQQLLDRLERRAGFVALIGPRGSGKTTLCRAFVEQLDRRWNRSLVTAPVASFDDLVRRMLVDFGVVDGDEVVARAIDGAGERVSMLRSFLGSLAASQARALLAIDDAQEMPAGVLADVQRFAEGATETLHILLAGEPSIERTLGSVGLHGLDGRIGEPMALGPLARDEVPGYVMHRIQMAGMGPRVEFDDESLAALYDTSGGVPGLVNLIADRALEIGCDRASGVIEAPMVETAAIDCGAIEPVTRGCELFEMVAIGVLLALLAGLGAGAAAWAFRDRVHEAVIEWRSR